MGRFLVCVAPTSSFGLLHPKMPSEKEAFSVNDVLKIDLGADGSNPPENGRRLVIMTYGPESKMLAKTLADHNVSADFFVLNYNRAPNALVSFLEDFKGEEIDVLLVDQNCDAALFAPVMVDLRRKLGNPRGWHWDECTIPKTFIPNGYGEPLLNAGDVIQSLKNLNVIAGGPAAGSVLIYCLDIFLIRIEDDIAHWRQISTEVTYNN